jgi:hypothetical protein
VQFKKGIVIKDGGNRDNKDMEGIETTKRVENDDYDQERRRLISLKKAEIYTNEEKRQASITYQLEAVRAILMLAPSNRSMNRGVVNSFPTRVMIRQSRFLRPPAEDEDDKTWRNKAN